MIRSYTDHAANERTFLAWVRTGLSAIALGFVVQKGSLLVLAIADTSSSVLAGHAREYLGNYGGPVLVGMGIALILGASVRFARTALRIDDENAHTADIVRLASAQLRRRRQEDVTIENASTAANLASSLKQTTRLGTVGRKKLALVGSTNLP